MKLWDKGLATDQKIDQFTVGNDRELDMQLAAYDVIASRAHARMLSTIGLITESEFEELNGGLNEIAKSIEDGSFTIEDDFEDMHSKIEYVLTEKLGDTGKKIHAARSRNDQVLVASQLYLKAELSAIKTEIKELFDLLIQLADQFKEDLMPGYTHLQVAMPSSFGLWFSAYGESLIDDIHFVNAALKVCDQNPLGSAAGYGSSFPIDRAMTTEELAFETLKYNVVAAQMGRGKTEKSTAFALSSVAGTLGKMAMDICLYMGQDFNFISFPDELTTGSSIMPHKKNPDVFELIRGKCNKLQAVPNQLTMMLVNLPSGYHRDLQLLKEIIVPSIQELRSCIEMMRFSLKDIQPRKNITDDAKYDYMFSVDTLNELVKSGMPFRDAYKKMGMDIEKGNYDPKRDLNHTHIGSIGQLCLEEIKAKMDKALV
ncbi:MAG: argininosuccinate lyase [Flavobacteriaceae bacterium]|jgi:argininosuccinate lyase|nr:argininosuccinate lyase [Flavobacteriaceae bacterium]NVJ72614.1 argininosuccinate lyase [Flavobacteriaceae bacterium]